MLPFQRRHLFHSDCRYPLIGLSILTLLVYALSVWQDGAAAAAPTTGAALRGKRGNGASRCPSNTSYSQFAQDMYLERNVFSPPHEAGTYVELGAYHPTRFSNTALFDRCYGWKGLCIDMNPFHQNMFKTQRTCEFLHTCVGNRSWADYYLRDDELGDGKEGVSRVTCEPFAAVLARSALRPARIDLLSIDIEGAEMDALYSFPFESVFVKAVLVETWRVGKEAVFDFLEDRGFVHKAELGPDDLFVWHGKVWLPPRTVEWRAAVRTQQAARQRPN